MCKHVPVPTRKTSTLQSENLGYREWPLNLRPGSAWDTDKTQSRLLQHSITSSLRPESCCGMLVVWNSVLNYIQLEWRGFKHLPISTLKRHHGLESCSSAMKLGCPSTWRRPVKVDPQPEIIDLCHGYLTCATRVEYFYQYHLWILRGFSELLKLLSSPYTIEVLHLLYYVIHLRYGRSI